jgi:hypothetical protein
MRQHHQFICLGLRFLGLGLLTGSAQAAPPAGVIGPGVQAFTVRPGYRVTVAADDLPECRFIESGPNGELFVSMPGEGTILELLDSDGDGRFDQRSEFVTDKKSVHGMQYFDGFPPPVPFTKHAIQMPMVRRMRWSRCWMGWSPEAGTGFDPFW